jgi:mono/diheme cytochrome c family protein
MMKTFLLGLLVGLIVLPAVVYMCLWFGFAPVATAAPPLPLERRLARMALHARMAKEMPAESPIPATEPNLLAGAKLYRENCAVCHGLPGVPQNPTAKGMFPKPPQLMKGKGVTDDPAAETYWRTANGIRLTGMPGYRGAFSEEQLWQVSQLLATADKMPQSVRDLMALPLDVK